MRTVFSSMADVCEQLRKTPVGMVRAGNFRASNGVLTSYSSEVARYVNDWVLVSARYVSYSTTTNRHIREFTWAVRPKRGSIVVKDIYNPTSADSVDAYLQGVVQQIDKLLAARGRGALYFTAMQAMMKQFQQLLKDFGMQKYRLGTRQLMAQCFADAEVEHTITGLPAAMRSDKVLVCVAKLVLEGRL